MTPDCRSILGVLWRSRAWRRLLNLIDHLPSDSHYMEARANDDELADLVVAANLDLDGPRHRPRLSEWSGLHEEIAYNSDLLVILIDTVRQVNHGKTSGLPPRPRPATAVEAARRRAGQRQHEAISAILLRPTPDPPT